MSLKKARALSLKKKKLSLAGGDTTALARQLSALSQQAHKLSAQCKRLSGSVKAVENIEPDAPADFQKAIRYLSLAYEILFQTSDSVLYSKDE